MNVTEFLKKLPAALIPDAVDGIEGTVQLNISTPTYVTLKDGVCTVQEGTCDTAEVALTVSDENLVALLTGKLNGPLAFMTGKLQIEGDLMLAKDIPGYFDSKSWLKSPLPLIGTNHEPHFWCSRPKRVCR